MIIGLCAIGYGPTLAWIRRSTWNCRSHATSARPVGLTAVVGYLPFDATTCAVPNVPDEVTRRARTLEAMLPLPFPCQTTTPSPSSSMRTLWSRPYEVTRTGWPIVPVRLIRRAYRFALGNRSQVSITSPSRSLETE